VTAGVQPQYTRLVFRFEGGATTVASQLTGNRLDLRFSRAADIDLSDLRAAPPHLLREIRRASGAGGLLRLQLTLESGVQQRHFADGDRVVVDLLPPPPEAQSASGASAPAPARPPVNGIAHVQLVEAANDTQITVSWPAPARAAAFRRGEAIWILFDAAGRVDLTGVARAGRRHQDMEVVHGDGVIGLRIPAPPDIMVSAAAHDDSWTFTLGSSAGRGDVASLERQVAADGHASLIAHFAREGVVRWINDPEIGDRIAVALFGGPSKGINTRRSTVEAEVSPSAHGAVVEPHADGVTVTLVNGDLTVTRGAGLIAQAPAQTATQAQLSAAMTESAMTTIVPAPAQGELTLTQIRHHIDDLERRAADEGVMQGAPVDARMELAHFLLQNDFAPEALGALRHAAVNQGDLVEIDPEFRLMRGEANVMMGRYANADSDLTASALMQNPAAALWRGYAAAQRQDWSTARQQLEAGAGAMEELPPAWRARFQLALANAAFELNDYAAAQAAQSAAMGQATDQQMRLQARFLQARLAAAQGDNPSALQMLDELAHCRDEQTAVRAALEAIRLRRATGVMRALDAVEPLEALRFRWRGDSVELTTVSMLGDVYSELGRWREALATMRIAADRFPNDPAARQLRADMSTLFERLFLDGEADQLQPIEALGLFYEFADLTPVGPNGDRIVRLLAGRLVNVDLLEQASQLLQHQVDERLQGLGKAQVAADLAAIYLMDHKPDRALVAIDTSRQPNMPALLLADRHILEARALLDLGRLDAAVELVERDHSENAQRVRGEAAWRARDWDRAAVELRTLLHMRDASQPLDADGRQQVLRLAVALTLAGDDDAVHALYREYAGDMAHTDEADAFEVVASGVTADGSAIRDVARAVARTDLMDRFMHRLRDNLTVDAHGNPLPAPTAPAQPGAPTPNTPPAPGAPPPAQATLPASAPRQTPAAGT
jgi:tetratricopeptide (TPR) repeat protein